MAIDFFDTIVTRRIANPDSLLQFIGFRHAKYFFGCTDFFARRKSAEDRARRSRQWRGDVGIDAIYEHFQPDGWWTPEAVDAAKQLELKTEIKMLQPRRDVIAFVQAQKRRGQKIVVVSDSYFPASFLDSALSRFGLADCIDEIYVSSERNARKDTGELWRVVKAREGDDLIVIGDNPHSDRDMAEREGLAAALVSAPAAMTAAAGLAHKAGEDWRADVLHGPSFCRLGESAFGEPVAWADDPRLFGHVVFGPLFAAFFGWLTKQLRRQQLDSVMFCAREGFFLLDFYNALRQRREFSDLPPADYLMVSRRSVTVATLDDGFDVNKLVSAGGYTGSIADFMRARLGFSLATTEDLHACIRIPGDEDRLAAALLRYEPRLRGQSRRERRALRSYLEQIPALAHERVGFVDIGYSATIQTGLQKLLDRPFVGNYMGTSSRACQVRDQGGLAFGCFQDAIYHDQWRDFMSKTVLLEALLTAPHGQVKFYAEGLDGNPLPVLREPGQSQRGFATLEQIYAGAAAYVEELLEAGGADALEASSHARDAAFAGVDAVLSRRVRVGRDLAAALFLEDDFSGHGEIKCFPEVLPV
jgi:FMN phosphatase YigB (HAD superfamily)